jgi:uncharacterized protein
MDIELLESWTTEQLKNHDASHDTIHANNVARLSGIILEKEPQLKNNSILRDAVIAIAWTHDICDRKYVNNKEDVIGLICLKLSEIGMYEESVSIVRKVVGAISFSARLARVAEGIESGLPPHLDGDNLIAYQIVSDADMLEAMGIVGMMRTFMYQAVNNHTSYSAFSHIQNRLLLCKNYLCFEWSKTEGARRHKAMENACSHFLRERYPV